MLFSMNLIMILVCNAFFLEPYNSRLKLSENTQIYFQNFSYDFVKLGDSTLQYVVLQQNQISYIVSACWRKKEFPNIVFRTSKFATIWYCSDVALMLSFYFQLPILAATTDWSWFLPEVRHVASWSNVSNKFGVSPITFLSVLV